jgi:N-acetylneuraminic acid mutarotase
MKRLLTVHIPAIGFFMLFLSGCIRDDTKDEPGIKGTGKPVFEGGAVFKSKTASSIEVSAKIESMNGSKVTRRGFCYGLSRSPRIENGDSCRYDDGIGLDSFSLIIDELMNNKTYYIVPYAVNAEGTGYGDPEIQISTNPGTGTVGTVGPAPENIYPDKVTGVGGRVMTPGEGQFKRCGIYYSESANFESKDSVERLDEETFLFDIEHLKPAVTYHLRAYYENEFGLFHVANDESFTTNDGKPEVSDMTVIRIGYTDIMLRSRATNKGDGNVQVVNCGFCWSESSDFARSDSIQCTIASDGYFQGTIEGLKSQQSYYLRAYAISNFKIPAYSRDTLVSTMNNLPVVQTGDVRETYDLSNGNANVSSTVTSRGNSELKDAGICWSATNKMPTRSDHYVPLLQVMDMQGRMSGQLTNLKGGTTYYIRAYAENANGFDYGDVETFTTPPVFDHSGMGTFPGTRYRNSVACFAGNGVFYLLGGDTGPSYTNEFLFCSVVREGNVEWQPLRGFTGGAAKWQTGVVFGAAVFVYGGYDDKEQNGLYRYDVLTNAWDSIPILTDPVCLSVGCLNSSGIFFIGGKKDTVLRNVWNYRVDINTWSQKTNFPVKQHSGIAVNLNGIIYAGMGKDDFGACNASLWMTEDGATTWKPRASCSVYSGGGILAGVACNQRNRIYVLDEAFYILEYNPVTDEWKQKAQLPPNYRDFHCMYEYNGKIYTGLGWVNSLVVYDPSWDNE